MKLDGDIEGGSIPAVFQGFKLPNDGNIAGLLKVQISRQMLQEWYVKRKETIRPWATFFATSRFKQPVSAQRLPRRVVKNVEYFQSNYLFVFIGLFIYCLVTSPLLLFAVLTSLAVCYWVLIKNTGRKMQIFGRELTLAQQYCLVGLCNMPGALVIEVRAVESAESKANQTSRNESSDKASLLNKNQQASKGKGQASRKVEKTKSNAETVKLITLDQNTSPLTRKSKRVRSTRKVGFYYDNGSTSSSPATPENSDKEGNQTSLSAKNIMTPKKKSSRSPGKRVATTEIEIIEETGSVKKKRPFIPVMPPSDNDSDNSESGDEAMFIIEEKAEEYKQLQNAASTKNMVLVPVDLTQNVAGCMEPKFGNVHTNQDYPGIFRTTSHDLTDTVGAGYLKISAKTIKPPEVCDDGKIIYWVIKGTVIVKSASGYYQPNPQSAHNCLFGKQLGSGACIVIPKNTVYTLENWTEEEAILSYCLISQR